MLLQGVDTVCVLSARLGSSDLTFPVQEATAMQQFPPAKEMGPYFFFNSKGHVLHTELWKIHF